MHDAMKRVEAFHIKNGFPVGVPLAYDHTKDQILEMVATVLAALARICSFEFSRTPLAIELLRAHLMLEELGETIEGLKESSQLKVLDGLADLVYVAVGTAVTFNLPLPEALIEVCRSNMTKERQSNDREGHRLRDKGPNYEPPDLMSILQKHVRGKRCTE